jgi:hypothetical protein
MVAVIGEVALPLLIILSVEFEGKAPLAFDNCTKKFPVKLPADVNATLILFELALQNEL